MGSLSGVRNIHECLCLHVRTVLVPLAQCFGMNSLGDEPFCVSPRRVPAWIAWAMHRLSLSPRAWACTLYLYKYSFYGMDSLRDAPIMLRPVCLGSQVVLVQYSFMAWTAWAMYLLCSHA